MKAALVALVLLATSSSIPKPVLTATMPVTVNVPSSATSPEQARPFFDAFSQPPDRRLSPHRRYGRRSGRRATRELAHDRRVSRIASLAPPVGAHSVRPHDRSRAHAVRPYRRPRRPGPAHAHHPFLQHHFEDLGGTRSTTTSSSASKQSRRKQADDQSRYFVTNAKVYDPIAKQCSTLPVGLTGFHVAQKADGFAEWIWSTFEQVDNVPDPNVPKPAGGWSFNNGTNNPKTQGGWANRPGYKSPDLVPIGERSAVQVTRLNAIPSSTVATNKTFQTALAKTPWRYYELVFTQWPTSGAQKSFVPFGMTVSPGVTATYEKNSGNPFPLYNVTNTTLETYLQSQRDAFGAGGNSCMQCHYAAGAADFSWGLFRRAHP